MIFEMTYNYELQYINGEWVPSEGNAFIEVENPADRTHFARIPDGTTADADKAVQAAYEAKEAWADVPLEKRIALMESMLEHFKAMRGDIIETEVKELGAPVTFTTATHCNYQYVRVQSYIDAVKKIAFREEYAASTVWREPIGVVACVTPWNYPLGQVVQKVVPAILMGNTVVLKPSQHTPLTACMLAQAFHQAGFPKGVFNLVSGRGAALGDFLAKHPLVDMISFTGSTRVGITLAQTALAGVKRISLELGGKSPYIWLPSEDYSGAVPKMVSSIFYNAGQTCTALSRLLVPEADLPRIEPLIKAAAESLRVGDPTLPETDVGPVSSAAQYKKIRDYILLGLEEGATMLTGAVPDEEPQTGYYIRPVIFTNVTNDMRIAREEIFGPVLCVITYKTVEEAVRIANDTPYGLSAAVFGEDKAAALAVAHRIKSGNVYVNNGPRDVTAPFGGYKESGIGREGGVAGLLEFSQQKAVFDRGEQ